MADVSIKAEHRFDFIDQLRGLVIILMALDHASYYFNSLWKSFDSFDPLFPNFAQVVLRYLPYLCAPGFLMMNGAMTWHSYTRRRARGASDWESRWHLIQRGLFLILVQITWVNSSWGGFRTFRPGHLGIIACIGISMILLTLLVNTRWQIRLGVGILVLAVHPILLGISYDEQNTLQRVLMQTLIDAGSFNKYPVMPWFGLAVMGSVMATGWLREWKTRRERIQWSSAIAILALLLATFIRLGRGYGNTDLFSEIGHFTFLFDQKYPPNLYHTVWFFGAVVGTMAVLELIGSRFPKLLSPVATVGKVSLFYYGMHIALMGVFVKRLGIFYREGAVTGSLIGWVILLLVMYPLTIWFWRVKRRSKNYIIRMI